MVYSLFMNLTNSQKNLLCRLSWESLSIMEEQKYQDDLRVLRRHGLVTKGEEVFSRYHTSDYGTEVLEAMGLVGKL